MKNSKITAIVVLSGLAGVVQAEPFFQQKDIFIGGLDNVNTYRIPAVIVTQKGTILAFCEARKQSSSDQSPTDLVLKRSFDNGVTWQPTRVVVPGKGDEAIMNPCPVIDGSDGTIFLLCNYFPDNKSQFKAGAVRQLVLKSTDDGEKWSEPFDITEQVSDPKTWSSLCSGPGVGIQTTSARLVIPCFHHEEGSNLRYVSNVIYSDNHGLTFKSGKNVPGSGSECQVVELVDGALMLNIRSRSYREVSLSTDGGLIWSDKTQDCTLIEPTCQGSILRYTKQSDGFTKNRILFSNPAHKKLRVNMTVRLSYDEGKTWPVSKLICAEQSAYSCLTVLSDGTIGLLYEAGKYRYSEKITFARFSLEWLSDGKDKLNK